MRKYYISGGEKNVRYIVFGRMNSIIMGAYRNNQYDCVDYLIEMGENLVNDSERVEIFPYIAWKILSLNNQLLELNDYSFFGTYTLKNNDKRELLVEKYKKLLNLISINKDEGEKLKKNSFLDIKIGDIVTVYDEYGHDFIEHKIKVNSINYDNEWITTTNPKGMYCHGTDLDEKVFGDESITHITETNFLCIEEDSNE